MRRFFNYFIYLSVFFLLFALYRADYLHLPELIKPGLFVLSLGVITGGLLFDALGWWQALKGQHIAAQPAEAVASFGLSIFGKYIPGKVWIIAGRAAYIARRHQVSEKHVVTVSFITQFVSLWVGLIYGGVALLVMPQTWQYSLVAIALWLGLTLAVFTPYPHQWLLMVYQRVFKKPLRIPYVPFGQALRLLPVYFLRWGAFALAFYLFLQAFTTQPVAFFTGLAFPLATVMGIVVLFAPGGVGVRESILVGFLKLGGLSLPLATTLSVASRLWFLLAETTMFLIALALHQYLRKKQAINE